MTGGVTCMVVCVLVTCRDVIMICDDYHLKMTQLLVLCGQRCYLSVLLPFHICNRLLKSKITCQFPLVDSIGRTYFSSLYNWRKGGSNLSLNLKRHEVISLEMS